MNFTINDRLNVIGEGSFTNSIKGNQVVLSGILSLSEYIPDIQKIENRYLRIENIEVVEESYGTKDTQIVYRIYSDNFEIDYRGLLKYNKAHMN